MARWEPGAQSRLQEAAYTLFLERGYDKVTVAEIAARAGLTKRTFFNYFTDKREILFADNAAFETGIVKHLTDAPATLAPIDAAIAALTQAGVQLTRYGDGARVRRDLIASSPELQERELSKLASLVTTVADTLRERHVSARDAGFVARVAVTVFTNAYADWTDIPTADFATLMQQSLSDLRHAVGSETNTAAPAGRPSTAAAAG